MQCPDIGYLDKLRHQGLQDVNNSCLVKRYNSDQKFLIQRDVPDKNRKNNMWHQTHEIYISGGDKHQNPDLCESHSIDIKFTKRQFGCKIPATRNQQPRRMDEKMEDQDQLAEVSGDPFHTEANLSNQIQNKSRRYTWTEKQLRRIWKLNSTTNSPGNHMFATQWTKCRPGRYHFIH